MTSLSRISFWFQTLNICIGERKKVANNDFTECNVPPNWIDDFYFLGPLCWPSLLLGIYCKWENWVVFTRIKTDVAFATKLEPTLHLAKGQLISKWFFGVVDFLQITNKNKSTRGIIVIKPNLFVRFLEEIDDPKNHFEIN